MVILNDKHDKIKIHKRQVISYLNKNHVRMNIENAKTLLKYNYNKTLNDKHELTLLSQRVNGFIIG